MSHIWPPEAMKSKTNPGLLVNACLTTQAQPTSTLPSSAGLELEVSKHTISKKWLGYLFTQGNVGNREEDANNRYQNAPGAFHAYNCLCRELAGI